MDEIINTNSVFLGSDIKINVHFDAGNGFTMDDLDWSVKFFTNANREVNLDKSQLRQIDAENYVACFNTREIGRGNVTIRVEAQLPDDDFDKGYRVEVWTGNTGISII